MKQGQFTILENTALTGRVSRLRLGGDVSAIVRPGQFVDLRLEGFFLRRPFSVCDRDDASFLLLYERVGRGTELLSALPPGRTLDVLTGLGNGFDPEHGGDAPLLIAGGTGLSPLYGLAKALLKRGKSPTAILGFNTASEVFFEEDFAALGIETLVCTADGSRGLPGFVTAAMDRRHTGFYACGPEAMLRAVCETSPMPGELSFDQRMGCGFGACMGCTVLTKKGPLRVCRDGPVLDREDVLWAD
ncbi:MAG: dihydroorotate dehydrogenase electron transfer subunit [Oscillospiraceae bacterium]|nr:dihydroorotate dehydrogenase electron transfer subunit [Oscillospiraceae bacterium]